MNLQFKKFTVRSLNLVITFEPRPNAVLEFGNRFSDLAKQLNGKLIQTGVAPNAPPEIPRLVVAVDRLEYRLGLNRIEVLVKEGKPEDSNHGLDSFAGLINQGTEGLKQFTHNAGLQFDFIGVVCTVHFPQENSLTLHQVSEALFQKLTKGSYFGRSAISLGWQVGFASSDGNHFVNFNVKTYQLRMITLPVKSQAPVRLDLNTGTVAEQGVEAVVDINNRPKSAKLSPDSEIRESLNLLKQELGNIDASLFGEIRH